MKKYNAAGRLMTNFFSMPNIEVITPTTEIQAPSACTVVQTDLKIRTESNVAEPPVVCVVL